MLRIVGACKFDRPCTLQANAEAWPSLILRKLCVEVVLKFVSHSSTSNAMSASGSSSGQRLQRSIQDLFSDEDDDMYEPATDQSASGLDDETETDTFTG